MTPAEVERFMSKVEKHRSGCWLWSGAVPAEGEGYGWFSVREDGKAHSRRAHRVSYEHFTGPIPRGLTIDHLCKVRHCVNPAHLEAVSLAVNVMRGDGCCVRNAAKTHCSHGHPFDAENTTHRAGRRYCRTCQRTAHRKYEQELRLRLGSVA